MKARYSTIDYAILTYMLQSGITLFTLPRHVAENFSYNGWLAIPIISVLIIAQIFLLGYTCKKLDRVSPLKIIDETLPKVLRYPLFLFLIIVWGLLGCTLGTSYLQLVQLVSFPTTPKFIFKSLLGIFAFYILLKGFDGLVKGSTIFFFLTIWILFTTFFIMPEFQFARLTPFIFAGDKNVVEGTFEVVKTFLGFELFILFSSFIQRDINITKAVIYGQLFTTFIYTFSTFISYGFFSFLQLKKLDYPIIQMFDYVQLPFLERVDSLIFSFFFMKVIITVAAYYWAAKEVLMKLFTKANETVLIFIVVLGSFLYSLTLQTSREITSSIDFFSVLAIGISIVLPILLLVFIKINQSKTNEVRDHG